MTSSPKVPASAVRLVAPRPRVLRRRRNGPYRPIRPTYASPNLAHVAGTPPRSGLRYTRFTRVLSAQARDNMMAEEADFLTLSDVSSTRQWVSEQRRRGRKVGLVPTMGALHDGHVDLARRAAQECQDVIVSIYVNPTQFGANEDLGSYPRRFRKDVQKLDELNLELETSESKPIGRVRAIFNPHDQTMYPFGHASGSRLTIDSALTSRLEGASRPTFFQGVTTVVLKLLNIVQPDRVYFGQKDIQQMVVIQRMIDEFHIPTVLRAVKTIRDDDGLALSSRNVYLGARRRQLAPALRRILNAGVFALGGEESQRESVQRREFLDAAYSHAMDLQREQQALPSSQRVRFELDYLSLAHPQTLEELDVVGSEGAIASGAMILLPLEEPQKEEILGLGGDQNPVRLIDNIVIGRAKRLLGLTDMSFRTPIHEK